MKVLMIGPARSVRGGISTVVNNYYDAKLDSKIELKYIGTMVDGSGLKKLLKFFIAFFEFLFALATHKIIHVHMSSHASFYRKSIFVLLARLFRKNIIIHMHSSRFISFYQNSRDITKKYIHFILNKADCIIALSKSWQIQLEEVTKHRCIKVLYNSVAVPDSKLCKSYREKVLTYLGRIGDRKGIFDLVDVLKELIIKHPDLRLIAAGDGEVDKLRNVCREKKLTNYVEIHNWIKGKEKENILSKSTIYVLPSYNEGMPMSILEAMSYKIPILSTTVGGIPEMIENGINGYLFTPGDKNALKEKLEKLLQSEEQRRKMGLTGFKTVKTKFNLKNHVKELLRIYSSLNQVS